MEVHPSPGVRPSPTNLADRRTCFRYPAERTHLHGCGGHAADPGRMCRRYRWLDRTSGRQPFLQATARHPPKLPFRLPERCQNRCQSRKPHLHHTLQVNLRPQRYPRWLRLQDLPSPPPWFERPGWRHHKRYRQMRRSCHPPRRHRGNFEPG